MNGPYQIKNLENQGQDKGTIESPYFFHITTGKKSKKKSVLFHAQIANKYFKYQVKGLRNPKKIFIARFWYENLCHILGFLKLFLKFF